MAVTRCWSNPVVGASRFVGDPVDIVTGAVVDQEVDFRLPRAAVPLSWSRRFDSRQIQRARGIGLGFRHSFDHELRFDLDGITYVDPAWHAVAFPFLSERARATEQTLTLECVNASHYVVHDPDGQRLEFEFSTPTQPARLMFVRRGTEALALHYENEAARLAAVSLGMQGRLRLDWQDDRIARVALIEGEYADQRETELVVYRYDERGCLIEARNAYKHSLRYEFDAALRLVQKCDRRGYAFGYTYDAAGRAIEARGEDGAEAVQLEYRPTERATIVTRHDGGKWHYQYDAAETITSIVDPYEGTQSFVTNARGRIQEEVDSLGNSSRFVYDGRGVAVAKLDPFGHTVTLPEDPSAQSALEHRVARTPLEWEYGALFEAPARLPANDDPLWELPVEMRRWLQTSDAAWSGKTRVVRTLQGLPLREERENGLARRWAFDENANVRWQIDFDGHKRSFEYGSDNHLTREIDALGRVTQYEHSPTEQLTALVDAGGTRSQFALDQKDRVIEVHRHGKLRESYVYDSADNVVEKRDGRGDPMLQMSIGPGNQTLARRLASGETQNFSYDERGQLIEARGAAGTCTFTYDSSGERLVDKRNGLGVEHDFDDAGARNTRVLERFVTRSRALATANTLLTDPTGRTHSLRQISPGVFLRTFSNGAREVSQYDLGGRCLTKALYRGYSDDQPWLRGYQFSGEKDLLERRDNERGTMRYSYDAAHRLQQVTHANRRVDTYEYDAGDNLVRMPSRMPDGRADLISERIAVQSGNRLLLANGERFYHDDRDNIARREGSHSATEYRRDSLDQLLEINATGLTFSAKYDALGRRTEKTVNGLTTTYYWDGDRLSAELFSNGRLRIYVYAAPLALVPTMFIEYASVDAELATGERYYLASNHLGAVELVLNDAGETVWRANLDPYGTAHIEVGQRMHQPLRFPGHFYDAETGLHYNRFRYYDPSLGRYLESDPLGIEGGVNLYAYTSNPLRDVDLRGLSAKCPNGVDCPRKKASQGERKDEKEGNTAPDHVLKPADESRAKTASDVQVTDAHRAKLKHLAPGVSAHDVALAEHHNLGGPGRDAQLAARQRVAQAFYEKNGQEYSIKDANGELYGTDQSGHAIKQLRKQTTEERGSQLSAVNYADPVSVGPPPPTQSSMNQWQAPGGDRGSYYANEGVEPGKLGIGDDAKAWALPGQPVVKKVSEVHVIDQSAPYMESTAGPADDKWSVPGRLQHAAGGGRQTYIPDGCNPDSEMIN